MATKSDLSETELKLIKEIEQTRKEIKEVEGRLAREIEEVELELSREIEETRKEIKDHRKAKFVENYGSGETGKGKLQLF